MHSKIKRILVFLRLIDPYDENLSFTNIALIVVLTKLMFVQTTSIVDLGALLVSLANLNFKKYINQDAAQASVTTNKITKKAEEIST